MSHCGVYTYIVGAIGVGACLISLRSTAPTAGIAPPSPGFVASEVSSKASSRHGRYRAIDLGMPANCYAIYPAALRSGKIVVGRASTNRGPRAFVWKNGRLSILPPNKASAARDVNRGGTVVGSLSETGITDTACAWEGANVKTLFSRARGSAATAVTDDGTIYGQHADDKGFWRAFQRKEDGTVVYLDRTPERNSSVQAANAGGALALNLSDLSGRSQRAAYFAAGKMWELPTRKAGVGSWAEDLNRRGDVVGSESLPDRSATVPRLWRNKRPVDLPIPEGIGGEAFGINDRGDIVGSVTARSGQWQREAFLISGGRFAYLDDLVGGKYRLRKAVRIDDAGRILAVGEPSHPHRNADEVHGYLLVPN